MRICTGTGNGSDSTELDYVTAVDGYRETFDVVWWWVIWRQQFVRGVYVTAIIFSLSNRTREWRMLQDSNLQRQRLKDKHTISHFKKTHSLRKKMNADGKTERWTDTMTLIAAFHKLSHTFNNGLKIYTGLRIYSFLIGSSGVRSLQRYMQSVGRQNCFAFW